MYGLMLVNLASAETLLREIAVKKDLAAGRAAFSLLLEEGLFINPSLVCLLIHMFSSCASIPDALNIFNSNEQNVYTWTCIIFAHAKNGYGDEALLLYHRMSVQPNSHTFVAVLKACANICSLEQVYVDVVKEGLEKDCFVGNSLVAMYARHNGLAKAQVIFDQLHIRDAVTCSAMITAYTINGQGWEAINLFNKMWHDNPEPDQVTFLCILKACASVGALTEGKLIHLEITKWFDLSVFLGSTLIDMYGKCCCMDEARSVFDGLPNRNLVCWNAIIAGYVNSKNGLEAMHLIHAMVHSGLEPNEITLTSMLKACTHILALEQAMKFHDVIYQQGFEVDPFIGNTLVDMYVKCRSIDCASKVFENLTSRSMVSWNAIMSGHTELGHGDQALKLYCQMQQQGTKPDSVTFLCVFKACANIGALELGRVAYSDCIEQGFNTDQAIGIAIIDTFAKCFNLSCAKKVHDLMPTKNVVSWSALIAGYAQVGQGLESLLLLEEMQRDGIKPNNVTFVCLLKACSSIAALDFGKLLHSSMVEQSAELIPTIQATLVALYTKCGSLLDAQKVFDQSPERDVVVWSAMIAGHIEIGHAEEALEVFGKMRCNGVEPNEVTYACILKACTSIGSLDHGTFIHTEVMKQGHYSDLFLGNTFVDMFAKCGSIEDACRVFEALPTRDVVSWSAMIEGYANHGLSHLALQHFQAMQKQGIKPVDVTYTSILSACCNAGLIEESHFYFNSIKEDYNLAQTAEHYACLVDLLGRAGQLNVAECLAHNLPIQSDGVVWMSLLGSCARSANLQIGLRVYHTLYGYDKRNTTADILLSSIYASNQMWEEVTRLQSVISRDIED